MILDFLFFAKIGIFFRISHPSADYFSADRNFVVFFVTQIPDNHIDMKSPELCRGLREVPSRIELLYTVLQTGASPLGQGTILKPSGFTDGFVVVAIQGIEPWSPP